MQVDFLVVGAGVVGVSVALELKRRFPDQTVTVIEKEPDVGLHSSGRNSGVIHAGFYYTADSLKARFTRDGNRALREYCHSHDIAVNECGKLVIATDEARLKGLDILLDRARKNSVDLREVDAKTAREIEPRARVFGDRALYSPTTASADPKAVLRAMRIDAENLGVRFIFSAKFIRRSNDTVSSNGTSAQIVLTAKDKIEAGYVINAAGLYADEVAHSFGLAQRYRILPFKGLYLYSDEPAGSLRTNIYPVPDLENPFLGVHFTLTADNKIKIGPTAIPAFWREQYSGFDKFSLREFFDISRRGLGLLFSNSNRLRSVAFEEFRNLQKSRMVMKAGLLVSDVSAQQFTKWGVPGIRAQLFDTSKNALEMDFVIEQSEKSLHILNAVSPGWTCSIPFSRYVVDRVARGVINTQ